MARKRTNKRRARPRRLPRSDKAFVHYGVLAALEHFRTVRPA